MRGQRKSDATAHKPVSCRGDRKSDERTITDGSMIVVAASSHLLDPFLFDSFSLAIKCESSSAQRAKQAAH